MSELTDADRRRIYEEEKARAEAKDLVKQQKKKFPFFRYIITGIFLAGIFGVITDTNFGTFILIAWLILIPIVWKINRNKLAKNAR